MVYIKFNLLLVIYIFEVESIQPCLPDPVCMNLNISETIRARATKFGHITRVYCSNTKLTSQFCHASFRPRRLIKIEFKANILKLKF